MAAEASAETPWPVRISKIAGRYLVFDPKAASLLRRDENTNGTLVGTLPQQPSQNIFLSLPIELRPEEVQVLVEKNAAYVVDDVAAHVAALTAARDNAAYKQSLRARKETAHRVISDVFAQKRANVAKKLGRPVNPPLTPAPLAGDNKQDQKQNEDDAESLFQDNRPQQNQSKKKKKQAKLDTAAVVQLPAASLYGVTPATSEHLVTSVDDAEFIVSEPPGPPLTRFLQHGGFYTTPGMRFGAKYSVYPGDPLRFHAHFMANQYGWDEELSMLELTEGGRLATAVKKAFVIGGEEPDSDGTVRTFSLEWAGM